MRTQEKLRLEQTSRGHEFLYQLSSYVGLGQWDTNLYFLYYTETQDYGFRALLQDVKGETGI